MDDIKISSNRSFGIVFFSRSSHWNYYEIVKKRYFEFKKK